MASEASYCACGESLYPKQEGRYLPAAQEYRAVCDCGEPHYTGLEAL